MNSGRKNDSWVLWLTSVFGIIAIVVLAFSIIKYKQTDEELPLRSKPDVTSPQLSGPGEFRVVRVVDGDSLTIVGTDGIDLSIRLRGVDSPELGQTYGLESKQALESLVGSASIHIQEPKKGKYGRYVVDMFVEDTWINKELVENGYAWCDQVNEFDSELYEAEQDARRKNNGLWSFADPVPPWVWREQR